LRRSRPCSRSRAPSTRSPPPSWLAECPTRSPATNRLRRRAHPPSPPGADRQTCYFKNAKSASQSIVTRSSSSAEPLSRSLHDLQEPGDFGLFESSGEGSVRARRPCRTARARFVRRTFPPPVASLPPPATTASNQRISCSLIVRTSSSVSCQTGSESAAKRVDRVLVDRIVGEVTSCWARAAFETSRNSSSTREGGKGGSGFP